MGGGERGQISMEYLLVTGFAFLLLVPIILIAYTQSARFSGDVTSAQVQKVGGELVDAANAVYYAGPPTKKTIKLYFPEGINTVTFQNDKIIFDVQGEGGSYEYVTFAATNLSGSIVPFTGIHSLTIVADENQVNVTEN